VTHFWGQTDVTREHALGNVVMGMRERVRVLEGVLRVWLVVLVRRKRMLWDSVMRRMAEGQSVMRRKRVGRMSGKRRRSAEM